jgi:hypothetical protein
MSGLSWQVELSAVCRYCSGVTREEALISVLPFLVKVTHRRSLGPAVISGHWDGFWIYFAGPIAGAFIAAMAGSMLAKRIAIAKLYHFDSESEGDALLRRK